MIFIIILKQGESLDSAIRRFRHEVNEAGIFEEIKKREFAMSKSQRKKYKHEKALKRIKKEEKNIIDSITI